MGKRKVMQHCGLSLIELVVSMGILMIIISICCEVFLFQLINYSRGADNINSREEMKIAMDFVYDEISSSKMVYTGSGNVLVDDGRIYLKNNILRFKEDQQQIACNINKFEVTKADSDLLYRVVIGSGNLIRSRFICREK